MKRLLMSVVAGVSALTLSGCTLIGFLAGKSADHKRARPQPVAREEIDTLKVGEPIEVQLWDGTKHSGRYQGLRWVPAEEYARAYEAARAGGGLAAQLPGLGPGADLVRKTGRVTKGELRGIAPGFVAMRERSSSPQRLMELDQVARLSDAAGRSLRGEELRTLAEERRVPSVVNLVLEQPTGNRTLELGQVASVTLPAQPGGRWKKGMLIGLALDAVVVTAVVIANCGDLIFGCPDSSTPTTSCPLVDSFDGREWRLDAEPLGGAFYPAAERTDVARLDHLVETRGEYRLRLRNDQQEIDHVDALALRVVDHPPGTQIVPDQQGRLHVLRGEERPRTAQVLSSAQGNRPSDAVAALLSRADGQTWASDLWARDASVAADLRDGVELAFQRPGGASSAVLVARVGATALGGRLLAQVLALHGRDLGFFYASLARDPAARARFERAREREVLPTVRVWDGSQWRSVGFLRDLPSLVQRDQAVPLDLRGIDGALRLRIDGPRGLWSIDRAIVAFTTGEDFKETRLAASRATREDGRDVTDVLGSIDGRRHSLRPQRDSVTLTFAAPPVRRGRERTVLVEATGHYSVIVPADGEPQREAFRRLVDEPGAVARFARERLRTQPVATPAPGPSGAEASTR